LSDYADLGDIKSRLPGRTFSASGKVTPENVRDWIDEFEAEVNGELAAAGFTNPVTTTRGVSYLRGKVASAVAGRVERAFAVGTDFQSDDVGADLKAEYLEFLSSLRNEPSRVAAIVGEGSSSGGSSLRSYFTDDISEPLTPNVKRGQDW